MFEESFVHANHFCKEAEKPADGRPDGLERYRYFAVATWAWQEGQ
jgi:hypothetical protein